MTKETQSEDVLVRFDRLKTWARGDVRAPHKPLLVLYALGRWLNEGLEWIPFVDVNRDLGRLLIEFGPQRQNHHSEYPFWRLQSDGVWRVEADASLETRQSNNDVKKSELFAKHARGGFDSEIVARLKSDPGVVQRIASNLLDAQLPRLYPHRHPCRRWLGRPRCIGESNSA
jgi:putative restriction endonuclease